MTHLWTQTEGRMHKWLIYGHRQKAEHINGSFMDTDRRQNALMAHLWVQTHEGMCK